MAFMEVRVVSTVVVSRCAVAKVAFKAHACSLKLKSPVANGKSDC